MNAARAQASLVEIYSSFQGEGPRVGERQILVRLAGCDRRCAYCDTPESFPVPPHARVQRTPEAEEEDRPANPVPLDCFAGWIQRLDAPRGLHAAVSITGGEPLLHPEAVRAVATAARALGMRVHLETGGHRPEALAAVLDLVDEVTPDVKIESATGEPTPWEAHAATLEGLARAGKALAVKIVVASGTGADEIERAAAFCRRHLPGTPLVLQPATRVPGGPEPPHALDLARLHAAARRAHADVRVIPQVHRILGVR